VEAEGNLHYRKWASAIDTLTPEGKVFDVGRVMYLRNYLMHLQRAVADGVPVRGYFLWSFLDNYECPMDINDGSHPLCRLHN